MSQDAQKPLLFEKDFFSTAATMPSATMTTQLLSFTESESGTGLRYSC
jgi:hypothetical protein